MRVADRLAPLPALQIRVHHLPHDGPGADDGHLDHDVVEIPGAQAGQAGHLRPALHLEHAHGVGLLERGVDGGIVGRKMGQVHGLAVVAMDEGERVFERGHHAQPQQIHLDDAQVGAVFLVPLHHHAAGHGGGLERHHRIELALADHHAAGVLAQVPGQVLRRFAQLEELADAGMAEVEAGVGELALAGVFRVLVFPVADGRGQAPQGFGIEAQHLAHLARGRAPAVGDDVGGHGGAALAVAPVEVLDDALALLAGGQVEIDVGPLTALFGEEALEEQFHAHRVHGGDAQGVADGGVGGGAAALGQDALLAAEAHQVPHDEEVAGQVELFDERQFALDLAAGAGAEFGRGPAVARLRALLGARAQEGIHGLARGHGIARELVAQVGERELQARRERFGVGDGFGEVGEKLGHLGGGLQAALGVARQQAPGGGQGAVVVEAGEDVENFAAIRGGVGDAVGGQERQAEGARQRDRGLVPGLLAAVEVALQFDVHTVASEEGGQLLQAAAPGLHAALGQRGGQRTVVAAGQADEPGGVRGEIARVRRGLAMLGRAQLQARDQAAEILVAEAALDQQWKTKFTTETQRHRGIHCNCFLCVSVPLW